MNKENVFVCVTIAISSEAERRRWLDWRPTNDMVVATAGIPWSWGGDREKLRNIIVSQGKSTYTCSCEI